MPVDERDGMVGAARASAAARSAPPSATKRRVLRVRDRRARRARTRRRSTTSLPSPAVAADRVRRRAGHVDPVEARAPDRRATTRKPTYVVARRRVHGQPRRAAQLVRARSRYEPPRTASPLVHSQTLPARSSAPHGDAPAGMRARPAPGPPMPGGEVARERSGSSSPHGQSRSSPPRAAASHSSSVGSRTPVARAERLGVGARDVRHRPRRRPSPWNCRFVTGTREMPERVEPDDAPRRLVVVRRERVVRVAPHRERPGRDRRPSRSRGDHRQHDRPAEDRLLGLDHVRVPADRLAGVRVALEPREVRRRDVDADPVAGREQVRRRRQQDRRPRTPCPGSISSSRSKPLR